jgi:5-methyltetrahydrofolate--homocysteine methyltransferase
MAQSNAGLPKLHGDTFAYDGTPEVMAGYARRARELGIAVIGGCCGSTPAHIAAMRDALAVSA